MCASGPPGRARGSTCRRRCSPTTTANLGAYNPPRGGPPDSPRYLFLPPRPIGRQPPLVRADPLPASYGPRGHRHHDIVIRRPARRRRAGAAHGRSLHLSHFASAAASAPTQDGWRTSVRDRAATAPAARRAGARCVALDLAAVRAGARSSPASLRQLRLPGDLGPTRFRLTCSARCSVGEGQRGSPTSRRAGGSTSCAKPGRLACRIASIVPWRHGLPAPRIG